jgi:hypothetical protein
MTDVSEQVSRRSFLSLLGLGAMALVVPTALLIPTDAEAQTRGMVRRQVRRTVRRTPRVARRVGRRTTRAVRRAVR